MKNEQVTILLQGPGRALRLIQPAEVEQGLSIQAKDLYIIELTAPDGKKKWIGSSEASKLKEKRTDEGYILTFTHLQDASVPASLLVTCTVSLDRKNPSSEWRIAIENHTGYAIQQVTYPVTAIAERSEDRTAGSFRYSYDWNVEYSSALLLGLYDGTLIPEPHENIPDQFGWYEEHPGRMAVQLAAYCDVGGGLCLYTKDGTGFPKRMGFKREGTNLDITPTHLFPREFGASVQVEYPVVLAPFSGDWTAAADLYREWAGSQEWMKEPLAEQENVPDWITAGYPFFVYSLGRPGATKSGDSWKNTLPRQMVPVLRGYEKLFDSPLVFMVYGWEKHYSWITPDVFPVYPGTEDIRYLTTSLHENGSRICLLNSGTRWAVKNPRDPGWDGLEYWEKEGREASCIAEDGEWSYDSRPWALNHKLCIAAEGTRKMMDRYVEGFADLGIDATQYDQNLGGESYVCYSEEHDHPQGYGRWMYDESKVLLQHFLDESRERNPDFATSVEEPNEVLIPSLSFYNGRPYIYHGWPMLTNMLCVGVPLFSYLYHDYAAGYGGDLGVALEGPEAERVKIGRTVAAGYLVQVGLMSDEYGFREVQKAVYAGAPIDRFSDLPALALLRNASKASQTFGHDWMILGKMRPHPQYQVSEWYELKKSRAQSFYNDDRVEYIHPESAMIKMPVVLCTAYISPDGTPGVVLINMSEKKQEVKIRMSALGPEWNGRTASMVLITNSGTTGLEQPMAEGDLELEIPGLQTGILKPDI